MTHTIAVASEGPSWILHALHWLQATRAVSALRESELAFSILEGVHVLGVAAVAGTVAIVDLRLLGLWSGVLKSGASIAAILRITWTGFALMVLTGLPLAAAEAAQLYGSTAFRIKLALLVLLGFNQWAVGRLERAGAADSSGHRQRLQRAGAALSLLGWAGVIIAGRTIAYL